MGCRVYTSHEVAALVQVSPSAVLRWIDQGLLPAFRTPGGHRRIGAAELLEFLTTHRMPVPGELTGGRERVRLLVIDDEVRYLRSLVTLLGLADPRLEVELCDHPVSGLLKVGLWRPQAVMLDAYMPGMDGLEVCRRLKRAEETSGIALIAMSGRPTPELAAAFKSAGAGAFLEKPLGVAGVLKALEEVGVTEGGSR
jgi:excisionase family DNA binding protein